MGRRNNLSYEVANKITQMIHEKKLEPGSKLPNEMELSEIMNVSRSTVREAIKSLVSNNIVEIVRGKGTFITEKPGLVSDPLGVSFIYDKNLLFSLFETRILIEPKVAYLAAKRVEPSDVDKLHKIHYQMKEVVASKKNHKNIDIEFHTAIARATKNPIIERIVPIIIESIVKGYYETVNVPGSVEKASSSHEKILMAIEEQDSARAEKEMKAHLEETLKDIGIAEKRRGIL